VKFGSPRFEGNRAFTSAVLAKTARIREGEPYTAAAVDAALVSLRRRYDDAGYPDVRVTCRPLEPGPDAEAQVENPSFTIDEGQPQRVRDIHVTGHVLTHEDVIRKALTIEPGSALSRSDLLASQTRLYGRGIFSSVSIEAEPPAADGAASGRPREPRRRRRARRPRVGARDGSDHAGLRRRVFQRREAARTVRDLQSQHLRQRALRGPADARQ